MNKIIYVTEEQYNTLYNGGLKNGTITVNDIQYVFDEDAEYLIEDTTEQSIAELEKSKTSANIPIQQTVPNIVRDIIKYMVENSMIGSHFYNSCYQGYLTKASSDSYYATVINWPAREIWQTSNALFKLGSTVDVNNISFTTYTFLTLTEQSLTTTCNNINLTAQKDFALNSTNNKLVVNAPAGIELNGTDWDTFKAEHPTSTEIAAQYVNLTGGQTIGGEKIFKNQIRCQEQIIPTLIGGGAIDVHPEGNTTHIAYFVNDLTGLALRGGSCTAIRKKDGVVVGKPLSDLKVNKWFDGTTSYSCLVTDGKWQSDDTANEPTFETTDVIEITIKSWKDWLWGNKFGLGMGATKYMAKDVKVEIGYAASDDVEPTWKELYATTNSKYPIHTFSGTGITVDGISGYPWNRMRVTLTNWTNNSEARVSAIWSMNYSSSGLATTLLSKTDGAMYGDIYPEINNIGNVGRSANKWLSVYTNNLYANTIYENNKQLSSIYGRLAVSNRWTAYNNFYYQQGTKNYTDNDGNVIYTDKLYGIGADFQNSNVAVRPTTLTCSLNASSATSIEQVMPELTGNYATLPFGKYWHDLFAFCKKSTPICEQTADGTTWEEIPLDKTLFNQKTNQIVKVIDDPVCGTRWTWTFTSNDLKNGNGEWLILGRNWSSTYADVNILVELKNSSDTDWTTRINVTYPATKNTMMPLYIKPYTGYFTNHDQLRLTLSKKAGSTGTLSLNCIKMLSNRWGGQGQGTELELPYTWDNDQNVTFNGNVTASNIYTKAQVDKLLADLKAELKS